MNERVFTVAEITAAKEKARTEKLDKLDVQKGGAVFIGLLHTVECELFADRIIKILTGNEKTENN